MTYNELKSSLTETQSELLRFIWEYSIENNKDWPPTDIVHREFNSKRTVEEAIEALPEDCVQNDRGGVASKYYLNLLGVMLGQKTNRLNDLILRFLPYARDWFTKKGRAERIASDDIRRDLKLADNNTELLGKFLRRGYLPCTGGSGVEKDGKWSIELAQQVSELLDVTNFREYFEELVMSYFKPPILESESASNTPVINVSDELSSGFTDDVRLRKIDPKTETISAKVENDIASEIDTLGFRPYVDAMHLFLTSPDTIPPLVVSIEGEWGNGKSSFLKQLKKSLEETRVETQDSEEASGKKRKVSEKNYTVVFDPWRYQEREGIWAAFGIQLERQLSAKCKRRRRLYAWLKLLKSRINGIRIVKAIIPGFAILLASLILVFIIPGGSEFLGFVVGMSPDDSEASTFFTSSAILASITYAVLLVRLIIDVIPSPQSMDLKKYLKKPEYKRYSPLIDSFINDFSNIIEAYVGNNRVFIFIEDLDRCAPSSIVSMISSINQILVCSSNVVFIIAMNPRLIAASFACQMKDIILISVSDYENEKTTTNKVYLSEGYQFAEKFIQLRFRLPKPNFKAITQFINSLSLSSPILESNSTSEAKSEAENLVFKPPSGKSKSDKPDKKPPTRSGRILVDTGTADSETVREVVTELAHYLEYNPRKIKAFINKLRLNLYIAEGLGILDFLEDISEEEEYTLRKIAKLTLIEMLFPAIWEEMTSSKEAYELRLREIQSYSESRDNMLVNGNVEYLAMDSIVVYGCEENTTTQWDIRKIDISRYASIGAFPERSVLKFKPEIVAVHTTYGLDGFQQT